MPPKTKRLCDDCAVWLRTPPRADRDAHDLVRFGLMVERSWCSMCSLITESILTWWDTQDPEDELMALFNRSLLSDGGERGEYVYLSHRRGPSGTTFTTTQATLQERLQGIPKFLLSPTFRDAVRFNRRLGYQYIWIDSLCIIQDSSADWENEAAKMGPYYQNAIVTISALQGQGPESGLGFDPRAVATTSVDLSDCKVWCRRIDPPLSYRHWTGLVPGTADDVLLTRG